MLKEGKEAMAVFLKPLFVLADQLGLAAFSKHLAQKSIGVPLVLAEISSPQPESVDGADNRSEQRGELLCHRPKLLIKGIRAEIIVQIPHQMHETLLLAAID